MTTNNPDNNFDKFTQEAKKALLFAEQEARNEKIGYIGTEHLLLGILNQKDSLGTAILDHFGVSTDKVRTILKDSTTKRQPVDNNGVLELTGFAKKTIRDAVSIAYQYNHTHVGTEHILYALLKQEGTAAVVIIEELKIQPNDMIKKIEDIFSQGGAVSPSNNMNNNLFGQVPPMMGGFPNMPNMGTMFFSIGNVPPQGFGSMPFNQNDEMSNPLSSPMGEEAKMPKKSNVKSKTPALDYFTHDLNAQVREGKIDPIIGREKEINRMIAILNRKTKNNPVLMGEPGVGKTAVVEGLVRYIVAENVPQSLVDKKVLMLDMSALVAGTKYRGEFEARLKQVLDEASTKENEIILFIDELHTVIGAGSAEGSLDAANMLKPLLGRNKLQIIGATTIKEYRKHVENDHAFERRFQPVMVEEPNEEDSLEIIRGLRTSFEDYHNVKISDEAIESSVKLSKRYITDRFLPDKAIDLLDEACAVKNIKMGDKEIDKIKKLKKQLEKVIKNKEGAVAAQDYEKATKFRDEELSISGELMKMKETKNIPRGKRIEILVDDIAQVISRATGIPINRLVKEDVSTLKDLEKTLNQIIIGQEEAISKVSKAIRRSRVGISDQKRPIGSFIFMGPTGVGKTALVKAMAKEIYNDENALIKIDMSEMMEKHNISRLLGTTAGYVGYEDGGQLTEAVRKKPYSIVLFDEIEKAHPDVWNILIQILEDGEITDGKGRKINFKNTIVVMTSNIGATKFTRQAQSIGFNLLTEKEEIISENEFESVKNEAVEELKRIFKPEIFNRIDGVVVFKPLNKEVVENIIKVELGYLQTRLLDKFISLYTTNDAITHLGKVSYDPLYGARPIRRKLQELVEDPLTDLIIDGEITEGDSVILELVGKKDPKIEVRKMNINDKIKDLVDFKSKAQVSHKETVNV